MCIRDSFNALNADLGIQARDADSHWLVAVIFRDANTGGGRTRDAETAAAKKQRNQAARNARKSADKAAAKAASASPQ